MKKLLLQAIMITAVLSLTACKNSPKDLEIVEEISSLENDEILKEIFTDNQGDQMDVFTNTTKKTVTVHLMGKTHELIKSENLPEYTAQNTEYIYTNIKGNITFLKKGVDMVLFRTKQNKPTETSTKMASQ